MLATRRKTACLVNACFSQAGKGSIVTGCIGSTEYWDDHAQNMPVADMFKQAGENTGNSVIGYSINKALISAGIRVIGNYSILPHSEKEWENFLQTSRISDYIVLCLQDLIRPDANEVWTESFFANLEKLSEVCSGKLCVVSLGTNYLLDSEACSGEIIKLLPENVLNLLVKLVNSAAYIQTRDSQLAEVLQDFSRGSQAEFLPAGCPSFLWKPLVKQRLRKNLLQLHSPKEFSHILVGGLYGSKSLETISKLLFIAQELHELFPHDFLFSNSSGTHDHPFYIQAASYAYASGSVKCFFHPDDWFKFIKQKSISYYIGTRLHGGIVALMNHIPSVFTSGDQRVSRFASTFALPHFPRGLLVEDAKEVLKNWDYEHTIKLQNDASRDFINGLAWMR